MEFNLYSSLLNIVVLSKGNAMKIKDFDYGLPTDLIPSAPVGERGSASMLVVNRSDQSISDRKFSDLPEYLTSGDLIVLNDTKVMPTLLKGETTDGAAIRVDLVSHKGPKLWEAHIRRVRETEPGTKLKLADGQINAVVLGANEMNTGHVLRLDVDGPELIEILFESAKYMLPMYLDQDIKGEQYQTVFAKSPGSNQPPVAGMHFTDEMFNRLKQVGVNVAHITLNIGRLDDLTLIGSEKDVTEHKMYPEAYEISEETADLINETHKRDSKVICIGTTTVRTLETVADASGEVHAGSDWTNHFITPGYKYKTVDALLSNLQPPFSTNIMLHSAFGGHDLTMKAYTHAVEKRYKFLEFGDCVLYL